jgi:hypothetical protein
VFGEIKHIEVNGAVSYVLFSHYLSALWAYKVIREIILKEEKEQIQVKLIKNEENLDMNGQKEERKVSFLEKEPHEDLSRKRENKIFIPLSLNKPVSPSFQNLISPINAQQSYQSNLPQTNIFNQSLFSSCQWNQIPNKNPEEMMQNKKFTLVNVPYLYKYVCNYDIQIENEEGFQITRRLIGNKVSYLIN